jgi:glycosyltransferase involved in cell wall biosynthesis
VSRHNSEKFFPKAPRLVSILLSRYVTRKAFASILISNAVLEFEKTSFEIGKKCKTFIVNYGLSSTEINLQKIKKANSRFVRIGSISRLVHQKNLPLLLNVMKSLKKYQSHTWHLDIVGKGPLSETLKELSSSIGVEDSITWVGSTSDVDAFYETLDIFVLTSNYEGFGLVLLEAMARGVPIVSRNTSAIPEVIGSDHPGLIGSPNPDLFAQKINTISSSGDFRESILQYQSERLKLFSIESVEARHRVIYENILSARWKDSFEV